MKSTLIALSALLLLFFSGQTWAQKKNIITTGQVVEQDTNQPIEAATVQLLNPKDSSQVSGHTTDRQGRFVLPPVKSGKYLLKVSFIGYTTLYKTVSLSAKPSTKNNLGVLPLATDAILLSETVITAEAPPVVVNADTTEYNASAYRVAAGDMLEELVKQLPGVEVDENGKITLNGEEIKKIMVNGKEFFGNNTDMSMKNLPADAVKKLKAYKEKSDNERLTGIKDGNETPVLDLTLKKNSGWMGNLAGGYGTKDRYEGNANISHFTDDVNLSFIGAANNTNRRGSGERTRQDAGFTYAKKDKKLDIRSNVNYNHNVDEQNTETSSETFLGDESSFAERRSGSRNGNHGLSGNARVEWKIDSLNTLNASINMNYNQGDSWSQNWNNNSDNDHQLISETRSSSNGTNHNYGLNGNVGYFHRFRKPGRYIFASAGFNYNENERNNYNKNYSEFFKRDSISDIERNTRGEGNSRNLNLSVGYIEPLSKHYRLSLNYNFSNRQGLSQSLVYDSINYEDRSNLDYNDQLSSKVENKYGSHNIGLSLQGEHVEWEPERKGLIYNVGITLNPNSSQSKTTIGPNTGKDLPRQNVLNWSPRVTLDYYFSRREHINLRYHGQSTAPGIEDLQEVIDVTDPLNLRYGNPNLKPSFTNSVNASYERYSTETMRNFRLSARFNNTLNSIANRMTYDRENGARTYHKENLNGNWSASTDFSFDTPLKNKKFNISVGANLSYNNQVGYTSVNRNGADAELSITRSLNNSERIRASYRSDKFDISLNGSFRYNRVNNDKQPGSNRETFDYNLGGNTNVRLPWDIELSTNIAWRIREGYSGNANRDEFLWNAQASKRFLKRKQAMIRFRIYDILRQQNNQSRSISANGITDVTSNRLTSYCLVSFTYRFNTLSRGGKGGGRDGGNRRPSERGNYRGGGMHRSIQVY